MPRLLTSLLLAGAAATLTACGMTGVAATVGEQTITISDLQGEIVEFSESFDEPLSLSGDLTTIQQQFLSRDITHLLLVDLAEQEGVEVTEAQVDELFDSLGTDEEIEALRAQFVYTEDGLRRAVEDEVRARALEPIVGDVPAALAVTAEEVGVEVNPRYGTWESGALQPGTGSISVPVDQVP